VRERERERTLSRQSSVAVSDTREQVKLNFSLRATFPAREKKREERERGQAVFFSLPPLSVFPEENKRGEKQ